MTREENRALCERFPFLIPSNRWNGMRITEAAGCGYFKYAPDEVPEYDYEYTELDAMPTGWRKAFGEQMCQEIMDELVANDMVDDFRIVEIKEKYASLRVSCNSFTRKGYDIIDKYERLSERTCIACGKPATRRWIYPYCDGCCPDGAWDPIDDEENGVGC